MKTTQKAIQRRTQATINYFRGHPEEFKLLHGVLIMAHAWELEESIEFRKIIDSELIAARMDELNKKARRKVS